MTDKTKEKHIVQMVMTAFARAEVLKLPKCKICMVYERGRDEEIDRALVTKKLYKKHTICGSCLEQHGDDV